MLWAPASAALSLHFSTPTYPQDIRLPDINGIPCKQFPQGNCTVFTLSHGKRYAGPVSQYPVAIEICMFDGFLEPANADFRSLSSGQGIRNIHSLIGIHHDFHFISPRPPDWPEPFKVCFPVRTPHAVRSASQSVTQ